MIEPQSADRPDIENVPGPKAWASDRFASHRRPLAADVDSPVLLFWIWFAILPSLLHPRHGRKCTVVEANASAPVANFATKRREE
jgi:hypothetical protein